MIKTTRNMSRGGGQGNKYLRSPYFKWNKNVVVSAGYWIGLLY